MSYNLIIKRRAEKEIDALPKMYAIAIMEAITDLQDEPRPIGCKKLKGTKNVYRIRVSMYRVVYTIEDEVLCVDIVRVAHRKDVYE